MSTSTLERSRAVSPLQRGCMKRGTDGTMLNVKTQVSEKGGTGFAEECSEEANIKTPVENIMQEML